NGVLKTGLRDVLSHPRPPAGWDSAAGLAERSSRAQLHSLTVPTLMVQSRSNLLFDLDEATAAYKRLAGPKRLYVGDPQTAMSEVVAWLQAYLAGGKRPAGGVELTHAPPDATTTTFPALPPTRSVTVELPGTATLTSRHRSVTHAVRLPGGPLETFGDGTVTVHYSGAKAWTQLVATVSVKGKSVPVTEGAALVTAPSGSLKIPLPNEVVLLPRGKKL